MTSYCPQTRFAQQPDKWWGGESIRYPTPEQAQASLAEIIATRKDLLETRIFESAYKPTSDWVVVIDPNGGPSKGFCVDRAKLDREDLRGKFTKRGKNRRQSY